MEKWFIKNTKPGNIDFEKFNLNKILYKVLINRNIKSEEEIIKFLDPSTEDLNSPLFLPDLIKASNIIFNHIEKNNKIRIVGDYDVDGVMSTYILYKGLLKIGANVDYDIPHRVKDGYGINKNIIEKAKNDNIELIITCDNGIAAFDAIDYANENNIDIIITDHHEVPKDEDNNEILINAKAVINPKRKTSKYPFKEICGGVVAYKLITYLLTIKGIEEEVIYEEFLAYAAIATVCDIMPLIDENRIIVSKGLEILNNTKDIGLKSLIQESSIGDKEVSVYHIGFIIGPTINSSGRLESASYALELLLSTDIEEAQKKAKYLRELNRQRQDLTDNGFKRIDESIIENNLLDKYNILIVYDENLNESVAGIIAGRIKEKYNRPTIILTKSKDLVKGSGRSIEGYNMFDEISVYKDYLENFGGHAMACGLSIKEENLNRLIEDLNNSQTLSEEDLVKKVYMDLGLSLVNNNIKLAEQLEKFEPYGTANPKALFGTKNLNIIKISVFGKNKNVIKLILSDGITSREAILFEPIDTFIENLSLKYSETEIDKMLNNRSNNILIDIVYTPSINSFRGNQTLELSIRNYRASEVIRC